MELVRGKPSWWSPNECVSNGWATLREARAQMPMVDQAAAPCWAQRSKYRVLDIKIHPDLFQSYSWVYFNTAIQKRPVTDYANHTKWLISQVVSYQKVRVSRRWWRCCYFRASWCFHHRPTEKSIVNDWNNDFGCYSRWGIHHPLCDGICLP